MPSLNGAVVLVTGANGGIGTHFANDTLARALAPILSANGESVIIDIHSAMSWDAVGGIYSATKAALRSATNPLRLELAPAGSTWCSSTTTP